MKRIFAALFIGILCLSTFPTLVSAQHDVVISSVTVTPTTVVIGDGNSAPVAYITITNKGTSYENYYITMYYDHDTGKVVSTFSGGIGPNMNVGPSPLAWWPDSGVTPGTHEMGLHLTTDSGVVQDYPDVQAIVFVASPSPPTLTVSSAHDSPSPSVGSHSYSSGTQVTCSVTSPVTEGGTSYTCIGWTGTGSVPSSGTGTSTGSFTITQDSSITWNWQGQGVQRRLTVSSAHDSPSPPNGVNLYSDGQSVTCSVSSPVVDGGVSYSCTGWTGTGSVLSSGAVTSTTFSITQDSSITWNWIVTPPVQYSLTVSSAHDSPSPSVGDHLYSAGSSVTCSVTSPVTEGGTVWTCTGWSGTGSVPSSGSGTSVTFAISQGSTITWNWQGAATQWKLTVSSAHDSPSPGIGVHTYNDGSSVTCSVTSPVTESGTVYTCTGWTGTGSVPSSGTGTSTTFTITQDSSITWNWIVTPPVQYSLTVSSAHDSPSPSVGSHSYSSGTQVTCSVTSPVTESGTSYTCTGWTGTGSVPSSGTGTSVTFAITQDSTITWNWHASAPPSTYSVTINAHCNTEDVDLKIPIKEDGSYTGFDTPNTFTGLTDTHTFTIQDRDYDNHPFAYWDIAASGGKLTTISVSDAGTHTAYYQALPYAPTNVIATPMNLGIELTWNPPTNLPPGYTVQNYYICRGSTPGFAIPWLLPYHLVGAAPPYKFQDSIQDDNVYYYRVIANFQQGLSNASSPVGCARLESFQGIRNTITGVTSILPESPFSFSIQQNFWIKCGEDGPVYWCQNCIKVIKPAAEVVCDDEIWDKSVTPYKCVWRGENPSPLIPDTMNFDTECSVTSISFSNSAGSYTARIASVFHGDIYILPDYENYNTCFMIVGWSAGEWLGNVVFDAGNGYVSCQTKIGNSLRNAQIFALVPNGEETGETSQGLTWDLTGHYWHQASSTLEGVYFRPNYSSPASQAASFDISGKPMSSVVVSAHCPVYLDLYDDQGRCVGYNESSGTVDQEIDNVVWVSNQTLLVFDPVGTYRLVVSGTDNGTYELETSWQDITGTTITMLDSNSTITENETQVYDVGAEANVVPMNILSSKSVVGQGFNLQVNATVADIGGPNATCDVTLSANDTIIGTQSALNLSGWNSTTASFTWNTTGVAYGNYTLASRAANGNCTGGNVIVTIPGDINGDFKVGLPDLVLLAQAYNCKPGDSNWNPNADIDGNGTVGLSDLVVLAQHYGQHNP